MLYAAGRFAAAERLARVATERTRAMVMTKVRGGWATSIGFRWVKNKRSIVHKNASGPFVLEAESSIYRYKA